MIRRLAVLLAVIFLPSFRADAQSDPSDPARVCRCLSYFLKNPAEPSVRAAYNAYMICKLDPPASRMSCYTQTRDQGLNGRLSDAVLSGAEDSATSLNCDLRGSPPADACTFQ